MSATTYPVWAPGPAAASLLVDGRNTGVATWVAENRRARRTGLLGTDDLDGALWITRCGSVHCVGMRYPIDVVYIARSGRVLSVRTMRPGSIGAPRLRARSVLELPAGRAAELGIAPGAGLATAPRAVDEAH